MKYRDAYGTQHEKPSVIEQIPRTAVYGICMNDGKVLCVREDWCNLWGIPGGGVEKGETLKDALVREFLEETGSEVDVTDEPILHLEKKFYEHNKEIFSDTDFYYYELKLVNEPVREPEKDVLDVRWIDVGELDEENMVVYHFEALQKFLDKS